MNGGQEGSGGWDEGEADFGLLVGHGLPGLVRRAVEDLEADALLQAHLQGLGVHDLEVLLEDVRDGDLVETVCATNLFGVCVVDAVDIVLGEPDGAKVAATGVQCGTGVSGDARLAGSATEDHHDAGAQQIASFGVVQDPGARYFTEGVHDDAFHADALQFDLQAHGVDHRGSHADLVAQDGVELRDAVASAPDVAGTDHHGQSRLEALGDVADLVGDGVDAVVVERADGGFSVVKGATAELEQY